jgi:3-isopropylmalate/(R)-2-methylmalate dehydratase large subunit
MNGMTITEKILSRASGNPARAGDVVEANIDLAMATDITTGLSAQVFAEMGAEKVFDPKKIALVNDHFTPPKDIKTAELAQTMRRFAKRYSVEHFFEIGRSGICHNIIPDSGLVVPGDVVVGADSHTCTYGALGAFSTGMGSTDIAAAWSLGKLWFKVPETIRIVLTGTLPKFVCGKDVILQVIGALGVDGALNQSMEFCGPALAKLPMSDRFTLCNMAVEAGAKTGIIAPDNITMEYLKGRAKREPQILASDQDASFAAEKTFDISKLEPLVAEPYLPSNVKRISQMEPVKIDQVLIGSCTNGRIEDFRAAAQILRGKKAHPETRLLLLPGTHEVVRLMAEEGLISIFMECGATLCPPGCGPCIGGHMGVLGENEVGLYTTNRNFRGRNGHPSSKVYLCGPSVAAASAIQGVIFDPNRLK